MRDIVDPYKGMKYSDIIELPQNKGLFDEKVPPLKRVPGTGKASWDASMGKYVV